MFVSHPNDMLKLNTRKCLSAITRSLRAIYFTFLYGLYRFTNNVCAMKNVKLLKCFCKKIQKISTSLGPVKDDVLKHV